MRTTLALDDDVFEYVSRQAKLRGVSMGRAASDLLRRGLNAPTPSEEKDGLVVFRLPADSPAVSTELVRRLEADGA
jgi:negative regulator of replication initiation